MGLFETNDKEISTILKRIANGKIQLPEFQRSWVWDDNRIKSLIASISNQYPVGAVMFLKYGDNLRFKYRNFTNADFSLDISPECLVLDGQQRLTSIFCSMYSQKPTPTRTDTGKDILRYYYIDIRKILDSSVDRIDAIFSVPEDKKIKSNFGRNVDLDLSTRENEFTNHCFPLNIVYNPTECENWRGEYQEYHNYDKEISSRYKDFVLNILTPIQTYKIPVISLSKDTPKEAVCQVFENVNTGGVSLTVFELITAMFAADNFNLRDDWDGIHSRFLESLPTSHDKKMALLSGVSETDFLTSLTLLSRYYRKITNGEAVSCKKKDILRLSLDEYNKYSKDISDGYINAAKFLVEQRIFRSYDLPYGTQLIPLAAIFAVFKEKANDSVVKEKIAKWYWCGVFGEMYGSANETRYAKDICEVVDWIDGGEEPDTVQRSFFHPTRLLSLNSRLSAAYKGIMALILKSKACDFISGKEMDLSAFFDEKIDIHHIFPRDYCVSMGYPEKKWNSIVNKTPISARTNRIIGGHAPSQYLDDLVRKGDHVSAENLDEYVVSHKIDIACLRSDNFHDYFTKRAKALLKMIGNATGKEITNLDSEDVVKEFGVSLLD